jgi:hypothetical protein
MNEEEQEGYTTVSEVAGGCGKMGVALLLAFVAIALLIALGNIVAPLGAL